MISIRGLSSLLIVFVCATPAIAQSTAAPPHKSDREGAGLRGPVEECDVKTTIPPHNQGEATYTISYIDKYNGDGNIYQRIGYNDSEFLTYDAGGHLLRALSVAQDGTSDLTYTYDAQGRLTAVNGDEDRTTTFEYDEQGRKTRIVRSQVKPSAASSTYIYGSFLDGIENEDLDGIPPDGGLIRTAFNERGQATETQVYDADGDLTSRLSQTFDDKGRVTQFSLIDTNSEFLTPEGRQLLAANPAGYEEMKTELVFRISYIYDNENHVIEKRETGWETKITKMTYNDHGDEIEEVATKYDGDLDQPKAADGNPASGGGPDSQLKAPESDVVQFSYQYDGFGNWIEKTVSSPAKAEKPSMTWSVTRRTITYY